MKYLILLVLVSCTASKKVNHYKVENSKTVVYKKTVDLGVTKDILSNGDTLVSDNNKGEIYIVKKAP